MPLLCSIGTLCLFRESESDPYLPDHATWRKVRNQAYSQRVGREELFERERGSDPDFRVWDDCVAACAAADD